MNKKITLFFSIMLLQIAAKAQQTDYKIKGTVTSENGKLSTVATVILRKAKDSSIVKTEVTNKEGIYEFSIISTGSYFVSLSASGFADRSSVAFTFKEGKHTEVPLITLQIAAKELGGVTVRSQKPLVEIKADKMVINVNSINATGSNAMELLQKSPGVVVDQEDNISVKGKSGVRIYIDGRPSQMDNKDLAALLRSMNSADIESIEFITNPSARFDASGNAGIINIKLKKDKRVGFNGNVSTGVMFGITPKMMNSLSLNYRNKKANFFGNYSNGLGINENYMNFQRQQADSLYDTRSTTRNDSKSNNFKVGADFFLNRFSTIGFIITGGLSDGEAKSESKTPISALSTGKVTRSLLAQNIMPSNREGLNYNANYKFADTCGHELNIDIDYGTFKGRTSSYQPNLYIYGNGSTVKTVYKNNECGKM